MMISNWRKQIKIVCSLVIVFAIAFIPAVGISNSSAQAAETAQRAPGDSGSLQLWQTFADFVSEMSRFATPNNIGPDSALGISAGDLGGWLGDYTSIALDMIGNPDIYRNTAANYADLVSSVWHWTAAMATHCIPEAQTGFQYPPYARYYEMQSSPFEALNSLEDMQSLIGSQTKAVPAVMKEMRTGYFDTLLMQASGDGYLNISGTYSELWQQSLAANMTIAQIVPDIDGDDNPDVLVHAIAYDLTTWEIASQVIAKSGHDGSHLWEDPEDGFEEG